MQTKISEANLSRVLNHMDDKDIAMITAFRTDPKLGRTLKENRGKNKQLESDLNTLGYKGYIKVIGYWDETPEDENSLPTAEETFLVLNVGNSSFEDFVEDMVDLAAKYDQQGVLIWNHKTKKANVYDKSGNITDTFSGFSINDITQGWTQIKGHKIAFSEALANFSFSDRFNEDGNFITAMAYDSRRRKMRRKDNV